MQASTPYEPAPAGAGLRMAAAITAFIAALLTIAALFPAWDDVTTLHDNFASLVGNLLSVAVLITAGVFVVVGRSPSMHAAAGLLLAATFVTHLGPVLSNVFVAGDVGGVRLGFWLAEAANVFLLATGVLGAIAAARTGVLQWRPNGRVESPVPLMAVGLLTVLYLISWSLPYGIIYDQGVEIGRYAPLLDRVPTQTWGFGLGLMVMVLAFGAIVAIKPRRIAAFLLLGLVMSDLSDLAGIDVWGYDADLGGTLSPGAGTMLRFVATVGLTAVALTMALARDETAAIDSGAAGATPSTVPPPVQWPVEPVPAEPAASAPPAPSPPVPPQL